MKVKIFLMYSQTISNQLQQFTLTILGKQQTISITIPDPTKKTEMSIKFLRYEDMKQPRNFTGRAKIKPRKKMFYQSCKKKHFLNLQQQSC